MKSTLSIVFIATLILLGTSSALAQTHRASIRGTVYDPNGAALPGTGFARLVIPADSKAGRYVSNLVALEVVSAPR